ncbi:MAG: Gfo/Idh/MocA family oxidoreductase [Phycisphaerae bacterium]|nr:Gfo/Idh/MocA family oxidoreductase [Phycisphaerae bacterium]
MKPISTSKSTRRDFLANGGKVIAASAVLPSILPGLYAAEDNTIRVALVGCGGRGSGAANQALSSETGPQKLYAMADVFEDRLASSHKNLTDQFGDQVDVPADRRFVGFDAYKKAIDCLRPGDVMIQATHSAFRATHVEYALEKGVNVFMEKSFAPDSGGTHRILKIAETAKAKNLKVGVGLMCRHSYSRNALIDKIRQGALGQVNMIRACRMDGGVHMGPFGGNENELLWQLRRPYGFFWVSSGQFIEWMIHQIDECCWIKDAWPISAHGLGGIMPGSNDAGQNFHIYSIEYTFADGARAIVNGRAMPKCYGDFATFVHGSKCAAQFSGDVHAPTVHIYKDQRCANDNIDWKPERERMSPYQVEWDELLSAIRNDKPYNEAERAAYTNFASILGRAAVHMGRIVTWDEVTKSEFKFVDNPGALNADSPAPVKADAQGKYPVPVPGVWSEV